MDPRVFTQRKATWNGSDPSPRWATLPLWAWIPPAVLASVSINRQGVTPVEEKAAMSDSRDTVFSKDNPPFCAGEGLVVQAEPNTAPSTSNTLAWVTVIAHEEIVPYGWSTLANHLNCATDGKLLP